MANTAVRSDVFVAVVVSSVDRRAWTTAPRLDVPPGDQPRQKMRTRSEVNAFQRDYLGRTYAQEILCLTGSNNILVYRREGNPFTHLATRASV